MEIQSKGKVSLMAQCLQFKIALTKTKKSLYNLILAIALKVILRLNKLTTSSIYLELILTTSKID